MVVEAIKLPVADDDHKAFNIVHKPNLKAIEGVIKNSLAMKSRTIDTLDRVCEIGKILRAGGMQITVEKS